MKITPKIKHCCAATGICCLFMLLCLAATGRCETGLGAGPAPIGPASAHATSVKDFGAKGNGVDDDTEAIENALEDALARNRILFFPPGEYLVSRGIYLESNIHVLGAKGAVLKKPPAITQLLRQSVSAGDKTVFVEDARAYRIGQDFYMWDGTGSSFLGTVGRIVDIDVADNKITFEAYKSDGARKDYFIENKAFFSSTFSMLTSNSTKKPAENVTIEGMTFDCQPQPDEPDGYPLSPIHIDQRGQGGDQRHIVVRDNIILNSHADGISVQASEDVTIENNIIRNCKAHGIHVGFTIAKVTVRNNIIENCGNCAIYWCYGIDEMIASNNYIKDCRIGCGGIDLQSKNCIIAFNTFNGVGTGINMSGSRAARFVIKGNIFRNGRDNDINISLSGFCVIADNIFSDSKHLGIRLRSSSRNSIVNNIFYNFSGDYAIHLSGNGRGATRLNRISGNIISGGKRASIYLEEADNIIISENLCSPEKGGAAIHVSGNCSDILLKDNIADGKIIDNRTAP